MEEQYIRPEPVGEVYPDIEDDISSAYFTAEPPPEFPPDPNVQIIITGVGTYQGLEVSGNYTHRSIVNVTHTGVGTALRSEGTSAIVAVGGTSGLWASGTTAVTANGTTAINATGNVSLGGGTVTVGRTASDDVEVLGEFTSNLIPNATSTYDIGSSSRRWDQIYADYLITTTQVAIGTNTSAATLTIGDVSTSPSNRGALAVKTLPNNGSTTQAALYLEEQVGTEGWYVIVNVDGDLNFNNSGASTDSVRFLDDDNVLIAKGYLGVNTDVSPTKALMVRGQGEFTSTVTAPTFVGDLTGIADKARTISTTTAGAYYPVWVDTNNSTAIGEQLYTNSSLQYNPSTNILTVGTVAATLQGSADNADKVLTQSNATNGAFYPTFVDTNNTNATSESLWTDAGLAYNPSTNTLTAGFFSGDGSSLTNVSATSATTVNTASTATNATFYPTFVNSNNGVAGAESVFTDAGLAYNPSSNTLTAGFFSGDGSALTNISATSSTAASTVNTVSTGTNATHYLTFVDSNNGGATAENLYTDGGILYNPSTNILSTGSVIASGGFRSDSGADIKITTSGTIVTFTVTGVGSTTLNLV
jgi:hypothetical protein